MEDQEAIQNIEKPPALTHKVKPKNVLTFKKISTSRYCPLQWFILYALNCLGAFRCLTYELFLKWD